MHMHHTPSRMHICRRNTSRVESVLAFPSCLRGHQVYKDRGTPVTNEELACRREAGNIYDPYAVAAT